MKNLIFGCFALLVTPLLSISAEPFELKKVVEAHQGLLDSFQSLQADYSFAYFVPGNSDVKTRFWAAGNKRRNEIQFRNGQESQTIVTNGMVTRLSFPGKDEKEKGSQPGGSFFSCQRKWDGSQVDGPFDTQVTCHFFIPCKGPTSKVAYSTVKDLIETKTINNAFSVREKEGQSCPVITFHQTDLKMDLEVWFSTSHNFAISQLVFLNSVNRMPLAKQTVEQFKEIKKGFFIPAVNKTYIYDPDQKAYLPTVQGKLIRASVDQPIPEERFSLEFPSEIEVRDFLKNRLWITDKQGKLSQFKVNHYGFPELCGISEEQEFQNALFQFVYCLMANPFRALPPG